MDNELVIEDRGAVRLLTINRPKRRNAFNVATLEALTSAIESADRDQSVGAVVLTGAGDHFSAGGDADAIVDALVDEDDEATLTLVKYFDRLALTIWNVSVPVIASVSGVAYGAACNLVFACDLVVAAATARFCEVFLQRGVVPDSGGAWLLPRLVGMQRAKELLFLAEEFDAQKAFELGLVNRICANTEAAVGEAVALGERMSGFSRMALRQTKSLVNHSSAGTFDASLVLESITQGAVLRSRAARAGFEQFLAKRTGASQ